MSETTQREETPTQKRWRVWGKGNVHLYVPVRTDRFEEGEVCTECGAVKSAPWHFAQLRELGRVK